jgi:hypothetical protein
MVDAEPVLPEKRSEAREAEVLDVRRVEVVRGLLRRRRRCSPGGVLRAHGGSHASADERERKLQDALADQVLLDLVRPVAVRDRDEQDPVGPQNAGGYVQHRARVVHVLEDVGEDDGVEVPCGGGVGEVPVLEAGVR